MIGVHEIDLKHVKKIKKESVFGFLSVNANQQGALTVSLIICARNKCKRLKIWRKSIHRMGNFAIIKKVKISKGKPLRASKKASYQRGIVYQIKWGFMQPSRAVFITIYTKAFLPLCLKTVLI